jgi:hypothetical protein
VRWAALDGQNMKAIAGQLDQPGAIAIDATTVYVANYSGTINSGYISKLAKP